MNYKPDILIIGGGILGSSLAYALSLKGERNVVVIDPDMAGTYSSSELNAGGVRATWWQPVNVEICKQSINFYKSIQSEVQFKQPGYLFMHFKKNWEIAVEKSKMQNDLGWEVHLVKPQDLKTYVPEYKNLKGISGATFSPNDGLIDPHLLKDFYRNKAKACGVQFLDRHLVYRMEIKNKKIFGVHTLHLPLSLSDSNLEEILTHPDKNFSNHYSETVVFNPKVVVNCAGAWSPVIAKHYGGHYPAYPVRRQIAVFDDPKDNLENYGMVVDPSGLYMHPEGPDGHKMLAGYSNRDEKPGYSFKYDGNDKFFMKRIWMRLYRRGGGKSFDTCHHIRGWAGLYSQSLDRTGILWKVNHMKNVFELGSATGRGVMQSYVLGQCMAELIQNNRFETFDATPLSAQRFKEHAYLEEALDL